MSSSGLFLSFHELLQVICVRVICFVLTSCSLSNMYKNRAVFFVVLKAFALRG